MMEILLVIGAAFAVFLLFFLVFAFRRRPEGEPVRIYNCHNCSCGKKEESHLERFRRHPEASTARCRNENGFS